MITSRKTVLLLAGTCAAAVSSFVGCNKAPAKADPAQPAQAAAGTAITPTGPERALASQLQAPPLPAPGRTDPEAVAMRKKYVEWKVAQVKVANDAALKQTSQFLGTNKPAPKGNYGRMADGLPQPSADKP